MNNKHRIAKKILIWDAICMVLLTAIDRVSKYLAAYYCKDNDNITLIENVLQIVYLENTGGAFGLLNNQRFFFIFIASLFVCLIVIFILMLPDNKRMNSLNIWLSFILAGTIGNMIDRILYGYVVDFVYIMPIKFPVFNFSDICISLGVFFTIILILFKLKEKDFEFLNFKQNKYREIK